MRINTIKAIPKTALDIFRQLPEGTLCEVINNALYMSPPYTLSHQRLLRVIGCKVLEHLESSKTGEAFIGPVDVYFNDLLSAVQPDLLYISNENSGILNEDGYVYGAPDLIVEILSSDKKRDTVMKKSLYERAGVKEYHIVSYTSRKIQTFTLHNDTYKLAHEAEGIFTSALLNLTFSF